MKLSIEARYASRPNASDRLHMICYTQREVGGIQCIAWLYDASAVKVASAMLRLFSPKVRFDPDKTMLQVSVPDNVGTTLKHLHHVQNATEEELNVLLDNPTPENVETFIRIHKLLSS
jgi:hypothetical protein